ncbi:hypothetical protein ACFQMM_19265 [Saliphagus sp. GCM10025308]
MTTPQLEVLDIDLCATDEENEGRQLEVSFNQRNSMIYTTDREPTGETLLDWLNEKQNFAEEGEHMDEFEDALVLVEGDFYALNSVTYRIERPTNQTQHTYDMLDHVDLLFKNELSGTQEYISLEEALQAFIRDVE